MNIGFIYALGAAITWGLVNTIDEKILTGISPINLLFINSIITAIIMLPFVFLNENPVKALFSSGRLTVLLIIISVILGALASWFIFAGIKNLNASTASIMEIAYPFFVILFSYIIFRSTPNIYFCIGGLFIFIGSVIIIKFA